MILKAESLVPDVLKIAVEVNGVYLFKKQTLYKNSCLLI